MYREADDHEALEYASEKDLAHLLWIQYEYTEAIAWFVQEFLQEYEFSWIQYVANYISNRTSDTWDYITRIERKSMDFR